MTSVRQDYSRIDMEVEALRDARLTQAVSDLRAIQARLDELSRRTQYGGYAAASGEDGQPAPGFIKATQGISRLHDQSPNGHGVSATERDGVDAYPSRADTIEVTLPTSEEPLQGPHPSNRRPREVLPERHTRLIVEMRQ
jgi:hypothetical protein